MREEVRVLFEREKVEERIQEIAEQINRDYEGRKLHIVCILKGAAFFACELAKHINVPLTIDFMSVSSYGDGMISSGNIEVEQDLAMGIEGRHILVVEDVVDSGRTLAYLYHMLKKRNPASIRIASLLDKPSCRVSSVDVAYCGFEVEDLFVVGYGLDYAQKYRNLPYIGEMIIKED